MRRDRDIFVLLLCLIPVGMVLYAFYTYQTTGVWPLDGSMSIPFPSTSVPAFLKPFDTIPEPVKGWVTSGQANLLVVLPGIAIGAIVGLLVIGTVADLIRVVVARLSPRWAQREPDASAEEMPMPDSTATL